MGFSRDFRGVLWVVMGCLQEFRGEGGFTSVLGGFRGVTGVRGRV